MKFAIPLAEGKLCLHFGHCQEFAFISAEKGDIISIEKEVPPAHAPGVLPAWLAEHGIDVVIAGGMGMRAQALFQRNGIEVVVGASAEEPDVLVRRHLDGTLVTGENACDH